MDNTPVNSADGIKIIEDEIKSLLECDTNYGTCQRLSVLYSVLDHIVKEKPVSVLRDEYKVGAEYENKKDNFIKRSIEIKQEQKSVPPFSTFKVWFNSRPDALDKIDEYVMHLRTNKPIEYTRMMDFITK